MNTIQWDNNKETKPISSQLTSTQPKTSKQESQTTKAKIFRAIGNELVELTDSHRLYKESQKYINNFETACLHNTPRVFRDELGNTFTLPAKLTGKHIVVKHQDKHGKANYYHFHFSKARKGFYSQIDRKECYADYSNQERAALLAAALKYKNYSLIGRHHPQFNSISPFDRKQNLIQGEKELTSFYENAQIRGINFTLTIDSNRVALSWDSPNKASGGFDCVLNQNPVSADYQKANKLREKLNNGYMVFADMSIQELALLIAQSTKFKMPLPANVRSNDQDIGKGVIYEIRDPRHSQSIATGAAKFIEGISVRKGRVTGPGSNVLQSENPALKVIIDKLSKKEN